MGFPPGPEYAVERFGEAGDLSADVSSAALEPIAARRLEIVLTPDTWEYVHA
jgi:hypothetical protein